MDTKQKIERLLTDQLSAWELAGNNYAALARIKVKDLNVNGMHYKVQFNPARIVSSAAKVDAQSIQERKCFLCPANLPAMQRGIPFKDNYQILINPFPIFPKHLTVPALEHVDQRIKKRFGDMLDLAAIAEDYIVFYNGPKCGASAPDHAHFQAGNKGFLPLEQEWRNKKAGKIVTYRTASLSYLDDAPRTTLVIETGNREDAIALFNLSLIHISEPTRLGMISYAVFCLKKKKKAEFSLKKKTNRKRRITIRSKNEQSAPLHRTQKEVWKYIKILI